jgi:polyisoprenoid-binding protein YceI
MRSFNALVLAALLAAAPIAVLAQPASPMARADPAVVQAGAYALEPVHSRVLFKLSHLGFTTWYGDFTGASGSLALDPRNPAASHVEVTLPTASVSTTNAKLDTELKAPDWLDADKFPTAVFVSRKVTPTGPDRALIEGDLTLHGITKPVTLEATFHGAGVNPLSHAYTVGFDATGKFNRSDFAVAKYVPMVGDEVTLIISAAFERKPG